ncbi:MAG TPA: hypothetical protein VLG37_04310 [Candidatus Saccharimonadales bacterium]|nr:hypothetical protein [Candidatus Saccharimonadales bacterium]
MTVGAETFIPDARPGEDDPAVIDLDQAAAKPEAEEPVIITESVDTVIDIDESEVPSSPLIGGAVLYDARPIKDGRPIRNRYGISRYPGAVLPFVGGVIGRRSGAFDLDLRSQVREKQPKQGNNRP